MDQYESISNKSLTEGNPHKAQLNSAAGKFRAHRLSGHCQTGYSGGCAD